jgi:hypothetical protein
LSLEWLEERSSGLEWVEKKTVADPASQLWEGQIERKKNWDGKIKKINKIKDNLI